MENIREWEVGKMRIQYKWETDSQSVLVIADWLMNGDRKEYVSINIPKEELESFLK